MRIGFFSDSYLPRADGIAYSLEIFRQELEKLGHEVYIIAPAPGLRYKERSSHVIRFPAIKGLIFDDYPNSFFFPPQALQKVKRLKLDLIHFHTPAQIGLLGAYFALRNDIPLVTTYHSDLYQYVLYYPQVLPGVLALNAIAPMIVGGGMANLRVALAGMAPELSIDRWNQKIVTRGTVMLFNHCDRVIAPSAKMEKQLKSWGVKTPTRIIPTGVDKITTTPQAKAGFRHRFRLNSKDQIVLFVGRLGEEKNISLLLESFKLVADKNPQAKLVLVGRHELVEQWRNQAQQTGHGGRIVFTGYIERSRLGAAYAAADVLAFPSQTDTQSLVLNEAAAAGVPIVAVDREITQVVKDGTNGYFARNSARDFAAKINAVLESEPKRVAMGEAGRHLAARFSAAAQAVKIEQLYKNVLAGRAQAARLPKRKQPRA